MEHWELKQMQSLPLEAKIVKTQQRIREWYEHWDGEVYVSFSGGKDSTVLLHLVRELYPDVEAVFVDTGLEYPEIKQFVKTIDNVTTIRPAMKFHEVIEKYGYPVIGKQVANAVEVARRNSESVKYKQITGTYKDKQGNKSLFNYSKYKYLTSAPFKISDKCCDVIKKRPIKAYNKKSGKKAIVGTMASESMLRVQKYLQSGCNGFTMKSPLSQPVGFWLESDIWEYIAKFKIPYSDIYNKGYKRTGCMFCMFGVHLEKGLNRFQLMQQTHPKQYDYCINKLGIGKVLDFIGVDYVEKQTNLIDYIKTLGESE